MEGVGEKEGKKKTVERRKIRGGKDFIFVVAVGGVCSRRKVVINSSGLFW